MTNPMSATGLEAEPISQLMRDNGDPEWMQIAKLLAAPPLRLRDELSIMLAWARYGERIAAWNRRATTQVQGEALSERIAAADFIDFKDGNVVEVHKPTARAIAALSAPAPGPEMVTRTEILREWFGGERYARDYEYLDASFGEQADRVVAFLTRRVHPKAPIGAGDVEALRRTAQRVVNKYGRNPDGSDKDWTEWNDLRAALAASQEPGKAQP